MSTQANVQIVKDFFAALGRGDKQGLLALSAEDIEWIIPGEDWPLAGTHRGQVGLNNLLQKANETVETSFPEPPEFVAQGDRVLVVGVATGKIKATNKKFEGKGSGEFIGRFSIETFIVAPGVAPAPPDPFGGPFPDASLNPAFNPVQLYHLGLWFNSPADAVKAGGPGTVTPFNGEHNAGVQVLNTSEFGDTSGPLENVK